LQNYKTSYLVKYVSLIGNILFYTVEAA
jgi:hypothetical protein